MQFFNELVNINTNYFQKRSSNRKEWKKAYANDNWLWESGKGGKWIYTKLEMERAV